MKILKYVAALFAVVALSATFTSCDRDVDPDVDAKQWYLIDFALSNPGSLNDAAKTRFTELVDSVIWGSKGATHSPMYVTEDYARTNFNAAVALPSSESDLVQKVMKPVSEIQNVKDFTVTMTLTRDEQTLASHDFRAADVLN